MATRNLPRRYPAARSKNKLPSVEFPSPASISPKNGTGPRQGPRRTLIYFIPGNPGLAGYYGPFLKTLRGLLDGDGRYAPLSSETSELGVGVGVEFDIVSRNLLGFCDGDHEVPFGTFTGNGNGDGTGEESVPFCLEDQICAVWDGIEGLVVENGYDEVILMGHSVGAYIGMEVFHRHHRLVLRQQHQQQQGTKKNGNEVARVPFNLRAGVMLFPTVWDIAQSPNGLVFDRFIRGMPFMDRNAHFIARWIVDWVPVSVLRGIIKNVMGFSDNGVEVTSGFLRSRDGIWQSLYLAKDEMGVITSEKWEREMWEVGNDEVELGLEVGGSGTGEGDRFFFLFGQRDHWVADRTRDAFIEKRKEHGEKGRVRVLVEETGRVPHAFCIHHSEVVAERVKTWIDEIVGLS